MYEIITNDKIEPQHKHGSDFPLYGAVLKRIMALY